jgi:nucleotide-binding universal stress UspA family protein
LERFQNILFPVDFSERCLSVAPAVAAFARRFRSTVTLLHAVNLPPGGYQDWYAYMNLVDTRSVQAEIERSLHRFLVEQLAGVETRRVLADGEPADAILAHTRDQGMDLVMMPTRGHGRFRSLLLGSVTAKVLHDSTLPVWTAAHSEEAAVPVECRSIVCAVDLSPATVAVLRMGFGLAQELGARCRAVFADADKTQASAERAEELFASYAQAAGVEAGLEIVAGDVGYVVPAAARTFGADLLVIGRGDLQGPLGRLRSGEYDLIRTSLCPVLSV